MKRVLFAAILCACALQLKAQSRPQFLGLSISDNTKSAFAEKLVEKGYKYQNDADGFILYSGQFLGCDASVMLVPSGYGDGITAVHVSLDEITPVKMGQLFSDLLQKYMKKYADYKYSTNVTANGGTEVIFRKLTPKGLMDFITIESKVQGTSCALTITYASDIQNNTASSDGGGISIDDI